MAFASLVAAVALTALLCVGGVAAVPPATHAYYLNGDYSDTLAGPAAVPLGGSLVGGGYVHGLNQGLKLPPGVVPRTTYSIELVVTPNSVDGYRKLIDFKGRTTDSGLYLSSGRVQFYPRGASAGVLFAPRQTSHVVITRNQKGARVNVFVNGRLRDSFIDTENNAVFANTYELDDDTRTHPALLMMDDVKTKRECTGARIKRVRVWSVVLSAADVLALRQGVKPPNA